MAERVGFEPTVAFYRRHAISSRAYSATLAPLREAQAGSEKPRLPLYTARQYNVQGTRIRDPLSHAGGEGGIRTHDGVAPILVFETSALNRSATSP